ncbi:hypothetical protein BHM03_00008406 [Ensete ventricosum]|nr:hypothetical protein BHM03_00008406 [Ensete ventricosum]
MCCAYCLVLVLYRYQDELGTPVRTAVAALALSPCYRVALAPSPAGCFLPMRERVRGDSMVWILLRVCFSVQTAEAAMTPIESTFSLDVNSKLDWSGSTDGNSLLEAIGKILARGHSRVPVYSGNPKNIIGLLLDIGDKPTLQLNDAAASVLAHLTEDQDGEVIGIITLEDVFEELLQEEIVDETDEYVDVHKRYALMLYCRIRVAAAAAASSVARAPSLRRMTGQKAAGAQNRRAQQTTGISRKPTDADLNTPRHQVNLAEPLMGNKR